MVAICVATLFALSLPKETLSASPLALHQLVEIPAGTEEVISLAGDDLDGDKVRIHDKINE